LKDLTDESMQALEDAAWAYKLAVDEIIKKHTDEELIAFSGGGAEAVGGHERRLDTYARGDGSLQSVRRREA